MRGIEFLMTCALITGITGFVGSHLLDYLIEHTDWQIHGLLRWRSPLDNIQSHLHLVNTGERIKLHYGDLRDVNAICTAVRKAKPDYVFHLAAQSFPRTSFDCACDTLETNIQGTVHLLDAIREYASDALVHVCSSSEVYGRTKKVPIAEDSPFHPASPYAISKVGTDLLGRHYAEAYGLKVIITRMFTHTGPRRGDVFAESSFAKQIAMMEAGMIDPVIKHGNLDSMRTIADVRDAVRAYHMAMTVNPQPGEVYNIGGNYSCKIKKILSTLIDLSKFRPDKSDPFGIIRSEIDPQRMRPIDADNQIPDCRKFKEHTGWEPKIPFQETMRDLLEYWRSRVMVTTPLQR